MSVKTTANTSVMRAATSSASVVVHNGRRVIENGNETSHNQA